MTQTSGLKYKLPKNIYSQMEELFFKLHKEDLFRKILRCELHPSTIMDIKCTAPPEKATTYYRLSEGMEIMGVEIIPNIFIDEGVVLFSELKHYPNAEQILEKIGN